MELKDAAFNWNKQRRDAVWGGSAFARGAGVLLFSSTAPSKGTLANLLILIIIILCGKNKTRLCSSLSSLLFSLVWNLRSSKIGSPAGIY